MLETRRIHRRTEYVDSTAVYKSARTLTRETSHAVTDSEATDSHRVGDLQLKPSLPKHQHYKRQHHNGDTTATKPQRHYHNANTTAPTPQRHTSRVPSQYNRTTILLSYSP
jgi:hypothetical protein